MEIRELSTTQEMLSEVETIKHLYPAMTVERYRELLERMIPNRYYQIGIFIEGKCQAISGYWLGTKLWCGPYLELDNVIVSPEMQGKGLGKMISDYLEEKAKQEKCTILVLDAYTTNYQAHRFYYNQGFGPKGFHFVKVLNENGLS